MITLFASLAGRVLRTVTQAVTHMAGAFTGGRRRRTPSTRDAAAPAGGEASPPAPESDGAQLYAAPSTTFDTEDGTAYESVTITPDEAGLSEEAWIMTDQDTLCDLEGWR